MKKIAHQVQDDRGDEHVGRPVVDLAEEQAGGHAEAEVEHRAVGLGHLLAAAAARRARGR